MQNILETRVLKKFGLYLAIGIGGYGSLLAVLLGGMWVSYHYFDSPAPFIISLFVAAGLSAIYMMANEKVKYERIRWTTCIKKVQKCSEKS